MEKYVKRYAKIYKTALAENSFSDIDVRVESYACFIRKGLIASEKIENPP